mmetsp:Transcript_36400/g.102819  ORF Transcript_36400/g.102819 Transcript_36400/m.102819 type:complete len:682 (-) Transcript_36400:227-2272(-)
MTVRTVTPLLLEYDLSIVPEGGVAIVSSPAPLVKSEGKDPAGHRFHEKALRQLGLLKDPEVDTSVDSAASEESGGAKGPSVDYGEPEGPWKSKGKKKKKKKSERGDLYALIGLKNERWTASEKQIKDAYRKTALEKHPDKCGAASADEETKQKLEDEFKKILEAYETLMDPVKRREYDSTDDFDDSLPSECTATDFFKVFGPAFMRQSRWAEKKPVPTLGDMETPWEQVDNFYEYWFRFKSWREFPHPDEEDVEQAECREHKRWIERDNAKLRKEGKKEETKRLKEFVENAYQMDPRVAKHKEEQKAERERKKQEKADAARKKVEEEERRKAEEEERRKEEAAQAAAAREEAKKEKEKNRKALQKERKKLRTLSGGFQDIDSDHVEKLCSSMSIGDLQALNASLEAVDSGEEGAAIIRQQHEDLDQVAAAQQRAKEAAFTAAQEEKLRLEAEKNAQTMSEWSEDEVRMLEKALTKFPQGTARRWEQVTNYMRTRSQPEILEMVKVRLAAGSGIPDRGQETFKVPKKRQQNTEIKDDATHRLTSFSDVEVNIKGAAAEALMAPAPQVPAAATKASKPAKAKEEPAEAKTAPIAQEKKNPAANPAVQEPKNEPAAAAPLQEAAEDSSQWSEVQELALVKALKLFGKELGQERWVRVAEAVPGKNKVECFKRFKELREGFRSKK